MTTYNVSQLPVIDGGENVGSVAEGTLMARTLSESSILTRGVKDVMGAPFPVVDANALFEHLSSLLSRETPAAIVTRNGDFAGVVTRNDVLQDIAGIQ